MKARLIESREVATEVRQFVFEAPEVAELHYKPGQFVSFTGEVDGRSITRAYSLASAPKAGSNRFELCLNRVKEGVFSPRLFAMQPGEEVEMRDPLGFFVPRQPFQDAVFVATGTGIAPFRSMLMAPPLDKTGKSITLIFGARYENGLLYRAEFESMAQERANFRFWPTITRPEPSWTGRTGWVQTHLDEALGERRDLDVYVCGLKAMVDTVREMLKAKGFDRKQIIYEKYD